MVYLFESRPFNFEKEVKTNLKMTSSDKIANLKKQIDFINGMIKYFNS